MSDEIPSPRGSGPEQPAITLGRLVDLSWDDYEAFLRRHAAVEESTDCILAPENSYLATIDLVQPMLRGPLPRENGTELRRLCGHKPTPEDPPGNCWWFGNLYAGGNLVKSIRTNETVRDLLGGLLPAIMDAESIETATTAAASLWSGLLAVEGIGPAAVSRFLSISRPDIFYPRTSKSAALIARRHAVPMAELDTWSGYAAVAESLRLSRWWRSPRPIHPDSARIWSARVALLDVLSHYQ